MVLPVGVVLPVSTLPGFGVSVSDFCLSVFKLSGDGALPPAEFGGSAPAFFFAAGATAGDTAPLGCSSLMYTHVPSGFRSTSLPSFVFTTSCASRVLAARRIPKNPMREETQACLLMGSPFTLKQECSIHTKLIHLSARKHKWLHAREVHPIAVGQIARVKTGSLGACPIHPSGFGARHAGR